MPRLAFPQHAAALACLLACAAVARGEEPVGRWSMVDGRWSGPESILPSPVGRGAGVEGSSDSSALTPTPLPTGEGLFEAAPELAPVAVWSPEHPASQPSTFNLQPSTFSTPRADPIDDPFAPAFHQEGWPGYLPEDYEKPLPLLTGWQGFLDPDPIPLYPDLHWPWDGHQITPSLVVYGAYSIFGAAVQEGRDERVGIGHQLLIDVDFSLGATERIHAQWRPLGEKNTGGSFLQLNENVTYFDNSSALPQRLWMEFDISEVFSGVIPDTVPADILVTAGLFPYSLHNGLLINDDIAGFIVSKNDVIREPFSKILGQAFAAFREVDTFPRQEDVRLVGTHWFIDWQTRNIEATYVHVSIDDNSRFDQDYFAVSLTQLLGQWNIAGRFLAQIGDEGRDGSGQLYVLESNWTRYFEHEILGFESLLWYGTAFYATEGWQSISGGNFDRLRSTFEVNPLVRLSLNPTGIENRGFAMGTEFFALHKDLALIPEIAVEFPGNDEVVGFSLRLRGKISDRSQLELRGIASASGADYLRRNGGFLEWTVLF